MRERTEKREKKRRKEKATESREREKAGKLVESALIAGQREGEKKKGSL